MNLNYFALLALIIFLVSSCQIHGVYDEDAVNILAKASATRTDNKEPTTYNCLESLGHCVARLAWGSISVQSAPGNIESFKDVIIWWNGVEAWDWKADNMHHDPGITVKALRRLLRHTEITDIILTRGMEGEFKVSQTIIDEAVAAGKPVHVAFTRDAVELFNKLINEERNVGGLFHITC